MTPVLHNLIPFQPVQGKRFSSAMAAFPILYCFVPMALHYPHRLGDPGRELLDVDLTYSNQLVATPNLKYIILLK